MYHNHFLKKAQKNNSGYIVTGTRQRKQSEGYSKLKICQSVDTKSVTLHKCQDKPSHKQMGR